MATTSEIPEILNSLVADNFCAALTEGDAENLEQLLLFGANPNIIINDRKRGWANKPLIVLASGLNHPQSPRCVELLLSYGANPHQSDASGLDALAASAYAGCKNNLKVLLLKTEFSLDQLKAAGLATFGQNSEDNKECRTLLAEKVRISREKETAKNVK